MQWRSKVTRTTLTIQSLFAIRINVRSEWNIRRVNRLDADWLVTDIQNDEQLIHHTIW